MCASSYFWFQFWFFVWCLVSLLLVHLRSPPGIAFEWCSFVWGISCLVCSFVSLGQIWSVCCFHLSLWSPSVWQRWDCRSEDNTVGVLLSSFLPFPSYVFIALFQAAARQTILAVYELVSNALPLPLHVFAVLPSTLDSPDSFVLVLGRICGWRRCVCDCSKSLRCAHLQAMWPWMNGRMDWLCSMSALHGVLPPLLSCCMSLFLSHTFELWSSCPSCLRPFPHFSCFECLLWDHMLY